MKIKKGTLLKVNHSRKGTFEGIAIKDFDTTKEEFYPIALAQKNPIKGISINMEWIEGEEIPCRNSLCKLTVIKELLTAKERKE